MIIDYVKARERMVQEQLMSRGINDSRVLRAMAKVPRHRFLKSELSGRAYEDHPLPIGANQTISQPYMVALMAQALELKGTERVLEVGTGSGYLAAVLSEDARQGLARVRVKPLPMTEIFQFFATVLFKSDVKLRVFLKRQSDLYSSEKLPFFVSASHVIISL